MADSNPASPYPPIADYALVGDCHTAALISRDGSVDWFCPGRFDAPAVFCRLLDAGAGGYFRVAPSGAYSVERSYRGATNVLETTFSTGTGRTRVTDCMPVQGRGGSQRFLRLLEGLDGEVPVELCFKPTFAYARATAHVWLAPDKGVLARSGARYLTLACPGVHLESGGPGVVRGQFRLRAGERRWAVVTPAHDPGQAEDALAPVPCDEELARTLAYWQRWASQCTYQGPFRQQVLRSALVLKLLTYEPTGAVVAAPTTSLPEDIGGERNWDYRYTWLRDSSLILYALMTIGYGDEAAEFIHWLEQTLGSDPTRQPQTVYAIDGRRQLPEQILDHLEGYRGSRPVRIGNAAAGQRQLDIFGEVLRAAALHYGRGSNAAHAGRAAGDRSRVRPTDEAWELLRELVQQAAEHWTESGRGIWEVRGGRQPFLYGKLMCWAALDVGVRLARDHGLDAPLDRWCQTRGRIRGAILEHGYDKQLGAFTQALGSSALDASALVIPRIGFLPPTDPRVQSTIRAVRQHLTRAGLVYRYRTPDGLAGGEGTFSLCTFWLVDALALGGQLDEAHRLFENMLDYANDLGLLAEEINPNSREQLGNFPQGFSHLALIGAAVDLAKATRHGAEEQPETEADRAGRASQAAAGEVASRWRTAWSR